MTQARELTAPDSGKLTAEAHKELGYYYRNTGQWWEADQSYAHARDALSMADRHARRKGPEEMASIQTNWAYVKGLSGSYRDGTNLVESAINVRHRLRYRQGRHLLERVRRGVPLRAQVPNAWAAYAEAEQIFRSHVVLARAFHQEQAICLYQADQDGINLLPIGPEPGYAGRRLITLALDLSVTYCPRLPVGAESGGPHLWRKAPEKALAYLSDGVEGPRAV